MAETEDPGDIRPLPESHHGGGGGGGVNLGGIPPGHLPPPGFGGVLGYGGFYNPARTDPYGWRRKLMQSYGVQGPAVSSTSPAAMGFSVGSPGTSFAAGPAQGPYGGPMPSGPASPSGGPYGGGVGAGSGPYAGTDPATVRAWVARLQQLLGGGGLGRRGQIETQELAGRLHSLGLDDYGRPMGSINRNPGYGTEGPSGPDPFGFSNFTSDQRGDVAGLINRLMGAGGFAGAFDPMGSGPMMQALQQRAESDAARQTAQAQRAAQYYAGSDPAAAGYAGLQSYLGGLGTTANAVNQARLQTMGQGQDFARSLLASMLGQNQNWESAQQQGNIQYGLQPDPWLQALGGLGQGVGSGIGSFIGGGGRPRSAG